MGDEIDAEGRLHIRIESSDLPCANCGAPGPNKRWHLSGRSGVQCVRCLSEFVNQINRELGADDPPSPGYQEQEDDMYCVLMRPGWYNIHRYQNGIWIYVTAVEAHKLKKVIRGLQLVGTSDGAQGKRRYYRKSTRPNLARTEQAN
jgi:hypothetical protein